MKQLTLYLTERDAFEAAGLFFIFKAQFLWSRGDTLDFTRGRGFGTPLFFLVCFDCGLDVPHALEQLLRGKDRLVEHAANELVQGLRGSDSRRIVERDEWGIALAIADLSADQGVKLSKEGVERLL